MNNGLYWFEHDLRLADNLPLRQTVAQVDQLHCIYIFNPADFSPKVKKGADLFNRRYMGQHRYRFIRQAIDDLQAQLHTFGQQLHIYYGEPLDIIEQLNTQFNFTHIGKHFHTGVYERNTVSLLRTQYPDKSIINTNSYTLYDIDDLPMSIDNLPDVFSPFRRKVEKFCEARLPDNALPASFPPVLVADQITPDELPTIQVCDKKLFAKNETVQRLIGGELKAKEQMHYYTYGTQALSEYKETRNGLEGWDFSSKLSPWL
ncbi:MAG: deoxyribodipyrimidine photo-lyase, partial [Glaciecola sp.]